MKIILLNLLILIYLDNQLFCNSSDTLKTFPEITVSSDKENQDLIKSSLNQVKIKLDRNYLMFETDKLLKSLNSINIKDLGGLGGLKTISIRGMSSNQTEISIDNIPLNSITSGIVDLSSIPLNLFDNVELYKSSENISHLNSSLNFITLNKDSDYFKFGLKAGSFDEYQANLKVYDSTLNSSFGLSYIDYNGNFEYNNLIDNKNTTLTRENSNLSNLSLFAKTKFDKNSFLILFKTIQKNIPEPVLENVINKISSKTNENEIISFWNSSITENIENSFWFKYNILNYKNSNGFSNILNNRNINYFSKTFSENLKYKLNFKEIMNSFELNINYSDLIGDMLEPNLKNFVRRLNSDIYHSIFYPLIEKNEFTLSFSTKNGLSLSSDFNNKLNTFYNSTCVLNYNNKQIDFTSKFIYSINNRLPNFNEMYYLNYGNTDLLPEKSINYEIALSKELNVFGNIDLSLFYIDIKNQIISIPKSPISWTALNIGKTNNYGIEISYNLKTFNKLLNFQVDYSIQYPTNQDRNSFNFTKFLPYISQEFFSFKTNLNYKTFDFDLYYTYNSFKYSLPDNSINSIIPGYNLIDLQFNYSISINKNDLSVFLLIENLLDKKYQIIKNYPLPGRTLKIGLNYEINN